jgi:hypothetical protein
MVYRKLKAAKNTTLGTTGKEIRRNHDEKSLNIKPKSFLYKVSPHSKSDPKNQTRTRLKAYAAR